MSNLPDKSPDQQTLPTEAGEAQASPANLPVELIKEMIAAQRENTIAQREQIETKKNEVELEKQKDKNLYDFNSKIIDKQSIDRQETRLSRERIIGKALYFSGFVVLIIAIVICIAIFLNKDDLAKKIVEMVITFLGGTALGGGVGFSYGKKSKDKENSDK